MAHLIEWDSPVSLVVFCLDPKVIKKQNKKGTPNSLKWVSPKLLHLQKHKKMEVLSLSEDHILQARREGNVHQGKNKKAT